MPVGVAVVDITPAYPIRLMGYGSRKTESEGIASRLKARALAIGADDAAEGGPAVLVAVDNCGVGAKVMEEVATRLKTKSRPQTRAIRGLLDTYPLRARAEQRARLHLRHSDPGRPESANRTLHPRADRRAREGRARCPGGPLAGDAWRGARARRASRPTDAS